MITSEQMMASRQLAARVTRWHTWPMIRKPTNGEHCARVATIYCELWGIPRGEVLYYCLHHDSGELSAGDTPFGAKVLVPDLRTAVNAAEQVGLRRLGVTLPTLTGREFAQFKVSDLMEMWECATVELNMGNQYAAPPIDSCARAARDVARAEDLRGLPNLGLPGLGAQERGPMQGTLELWMDNKWRADQ